MHDRWRTAVIAGAVGLAIGAVWSPRRPAERPAYQVAATSGVPDDAPFEIVAASTAVADPKPAAPEATPPAPGLDRARVVGALARGGARLLEGRGREARLSETFKILLAITPAEERIINEALQQTHDAVTAAELAFAQAAPGVGDEEGAWVISIPHFTEHGATLHDQLHHTIATTLGPERLAQFEQLGGPQLENAMRRIGAQERRVVITAKKNPATGQVTYESKDHFVSAEARGSSGGSFMNRAMLDQHFGELTKRLLPPDFGSNE